MPDEINNPNNLPTNDDLNAVLAREATSSPSQHIDSASLKQKLSQQGMASKQDSAYLHQQVKPGQIIGYGIPTDQKVVLPQPKGARGLSKKTLRYLVFMVIGVLTILVIYVVIVIARNIANQS